MRFSTRLYDDGEEYRVVAVIRTPEIVTDYGRDNARTLEWKFPTIGQANSFAHEIETEYPNMEVRVFSRIQSAKWKDITR